MKEITTSVREGDRYIMKSQVHSVAHSFAHWILIVLDIGLEKEVKRNLHV